jgi:hypothetical protein
MRMWHKELWRHALQRWLAILTAILFVTNLVASAQSIPFGLTPELHRTVLSDKAEQSEDPGPVSLFSPLKPQPLEAPYKPLTPSQRFSWFATSTFGPPHMTGVALLSAGGTAVNRPEECGSHWSGLADRFGVAMAGSAAGNAIEASAGLALREDPRYFRMQQQTFKARVGNVVRLTFLARGENGGFSPAYARYIAIAGSNFLSNAWRVHSETNAGAALLRSSEGFGGCMAANGFAEFWPDVKKYVFHARHRAAQRRPDD